MKGKIIASQFNPGYDSWVLKQTKYGLFDGHCYFKEEDADIENSIDGCRISEFRADSRAYKEKAKFLRQRAIGAAIIVNNLYDELPEDIWNKLIKQVDYMEREADKAWEYYYRRKDYEPIFINNTLQKRREVQQMKKSKE